MTVNIIQVEPSLARQPVSGGTRQLGYQIAQHPEGVGGGMSRITLTAGEKTVDVLPARGMGIWQATHTGIRFGWASPVRGPVHPGWVPLSDPDGLGWLEGFDEMLVRCGLASNGAPEFDDRGRLVFPLHGRIANLPAHRRVDRNR